MASKVNRSAWEKSAADGKPAPAAGTGGKAAFFEQAVKDAAPKKVEKKKTWATTGNSGGYSNDGKYAGKTKIGDGPPPPKSVSDLP